MVSESVAPGWQRNISFRALKQTLLEHRHDVAAALRAAISPTTPDSLLNDASPAESTVCGCPRRPDGYDDLEDVVAHPTNERR